MKAVQINIHEPRIQIKLPGAVKVPLAASMSTHIQVRRRYKCRCDSDILLSTITKYHNIIIFHNNNIIHTHRNQFLTPAAAVGDPKFPQS